MLSFSYFLQILRDLLIMYDNSSYLDKLLGTSFFNRKSYHFKVSNIIISLLEYLTQIVCESDVVRTSANTCQKPRD